MKRTSRTVNDERQLALFDDLRAPSEDQLMRRFYARLRQLGITLHLDRDKPDIVAHRKRLGAPAWWAPFARRHYARIKRDLLRVEYGITEEIERQDLDGGAELLRLPDRHLDPSLDPPVSNPIPARRPGRGSA